MMKNDSQPALEYSTAILVYIVVAYTEIGYPCRFSLSPSFLLNFVPCLIDTTLVLINRTLVPLYVMVVANAAYSI